MGFFIENENLKKKNIFTISLGLRNRNGRLKEDHIAYILHETLKGLIHLHENHCMHRYGTSKN